MKYRNTLLLVGALAFLLGRAPALATPTPSADASALDATGHVPAPINLEADLRDGRLRLSFLIDRYLFRHWTGIDARSLADLDEAAYDARRAEVAEFLALNAPVAIDAIDVRPVVEDLAFLEGSQETDFLQFVEVVAIYGAKGEPGSIEFYWSRFDTEDDYPLESAFLVFSSPDDYRVFELTENQPFDVWNRPGARPTIDPETVAPGVPDPRGKLPLVSIAFLLVGVGTGLALRSRRSRGEGGLGVAGVVGVITVGIVGAYFTAPVAVVPFRWPGEPTVVLPPEEDARALFETLHRNIYRAFDYDDESAVYDALARSLAPSLVDEVYGEVYRSLKMKLEFSEDAACEIRSVRMLDSTVDFPADPVEASFDVVARWEVIGTVRHWGHGHWRTNRYGARYRVRWNDEDGWRIGAVEVLEQERLDDGREVAL